jgi:hypothetical protein
MMLSGDHHRERKKSSFHLWMRAARFDDASWRSSTREKKIIFPSMDACGKVSRNKNDQCSSAVKLP